VGLSDFKASTGSMTIHSGGTFDSSLKVWPKFTFTRVSDGLTKVLDTGSGSGLTGATASDDDIAIEPNPNPEPTIAPAPCPVTEIDEFEGQIKISNGATLDATASRSCAPVTLTSTNSPWALCPGFCIPFPITEQELLASHFASPPGTKKRLATRTLGTAE